jgi:hypothetical protein
MTVALAGSRAPRPTLVWAAAPPATMWPAATMASQTFLALPYGMDSPETFVPTAVSLPAGRVSTYMPAPLKFRTACPYVSLVTENPLEP